MNKMAKPFSSKILNAPHVHTFQLGKHGNVEHLFVTGNIVEQSLEFMDSIVQAARKQRSAHLLQLSKSMNSFFASSLIARSAHPLFQVSKSFSPFLCKQPDSKARVAVSYPEANLISNHELSFRSPASPARVQLHPQDCFPSVRGSRSFLSPCAVEVVFAICRESSAS